MNQQSEHPVPNTRVVITGMGVVSCLGSGVGAFWEGLTASRSGIGPIQSFDVTGLRNPEGGEVRDWPEETLPEWAAGMDDAVRFALAAGLEAMACAGVEAPLGPNAGVILATNFGGAGTFQKWASDRRSGVGASSRFSDFSSESTIGKANVPRSDDAGFKSSLMSTATDALALLAGATGPRASLSLSCSSGAAAIGMALDWIRLGKAEIMIAGGYDALTLYSLSGLSCLRTVTTEKIRPFDKNRSGTVFGEGAGVVILESESRAVARQVRPLAVVSGWASNNNAHHLTAPQTDGRGLLQVMRGACDDAQRGPSAIDYVNAHGTGTRYNDPAETSALHELLGARAQETPVSSIKAAISHTMGAAGAIEAIACVQAIRTGILPPTLNWSERDPDCDLDYLPNESRERSIACALSVSSGIGGNNAALLLEKYD